MPQLTFNHLEVFRIDPRYNIASLVEKCRKIHIKFLVVVSAKQVALQVISICTIHDYFFFVIHTMLVMYLCLIRAQLWSSTDQKSKQCLKQTENVNTQGVEKDRAILPEVSPRKHDKANEGSCWCTRGLHQMFNVYLTGTFNYLLNELTLSQKGDKLLI